MLGLSWHLMDCIVICPDFAEGAERLELGCRKAGTRTHLGDWEWEPRAAWPAAGLHLGPILKLCQFTHPSVRDQPALLLLLVGFYPTMFHGGFEVATTCHPELGLSATCPGRDACGRWAILCGNTSSCVVRCCKSPQVDWLSQSSSPQGPPSGPWVNWGPGATKLGATPWLTVTVVWEGTAHCENSHKSLRLITVNNSNSKREFAIFWSVN